MESKNNFEVIIVGCGIAGASLAYFLAERGLSDLLILEREDQPGYHATGRSAATLVELDPVLSVLQLKTLAAPFLRDPPEGFTDNPLLYPSGIMALFHGDEWSLIEKIAPGMEQAGVKLELLTPSEVMEKVPAVSGGHFDGGVFLPEDGRLDVHELLWSYIRNAKKKGAELRCGVEVKSIKVDRGKCKGVATDAGELSARWVVNAAGAWTGVIGSLAGAAPIELTPLRRTIITFASPEGLDTEAWPLTANYTHHLYFAPESGGLLASPMDEDPVEPCDAYPDELVVATTVDRLGSLAPRLVPKTLTNKWAGLRTFSPDQSFVIGEDPQVKGFFWLAGQGGTGIETSPAAGQIAADLIIDNRTELVDANALSPARFA